MLDGKRKNVPASTTSGSSTTSSSNSPALINSLTLASKGSSSTSSPILNQTLSSPDCLSSTNSPSSATKSGLNTLRLGALPSAAPTFASSNTKNEQLLSMIKKGSTSGIINSSHGSSLPAHNADGKDDTGLSNTSIGSKNSSDLLMTLLHSSRHNGKTFDPDASLVDKAAHNSAPASHRAATGDSGLETSSDETVIMGLADIIKRIHSDRMSIALGLDSDAIISSMGDLAVLYDGPFASNVQNLNESKSPTESKHFNSAASLNDGLNIKTESGPNGPPNTNINTFTGTITSNISNPLNNNSSFNSNRSGSNNLNTAFIDSNTKTYYNTNNTNNTNTNNNFELMAKKDVLPLKKGLKGNLLQLSKVLSSPWAHGPMYSSDHVDTFSSIGMSGIAAASVISDDSNRTQSSPWRTDPRRQAGGGSLEAILPSCYNIQAAPQATSRIASFAEETLFYMFYGMPRDQMQELAAQELTLSRGWRYHKNLALWFLPSTAQANIIPSSITVNAKAISSSRPDPNSQQSNTSDLLLGLNDLSISNATSSLKNSELYFDPAKNSQSNYPNYDSANNNINIINTNNNNASVSKANSAGSTTVTSTSNPLGSSEFPMSFTIFDPTTWTKVRRNLGFITEDQIENRFVNEKQFSTSIKIGNTDGAAKSIPSGGASEIKSPPPSASTKVY